MTTETQAPDPAQPKLEDIEQYRMQMAAISTAALGYWTEADTIHPDYDTVPLRDVAKLYAKYDKLFKEKVEAQANPPQPAIPAPEGALPPLPPHPDARVFTWTSRELDAIKRYGEECARAALAAPAPQAAPIAWLMTADDDGSADWVERGAAQPAPVAGFRAVPLGPLAAPQAPAWQPIETAPKDGREMFVVRAFGIDPTGRATTGGYTSDAYAVFRGANGRLVRWPHIWPPTHWMPLPAAPQTKEPKA